MAKEMKKYAVAACPRYTPFPKPLILRLGSTSLTTGRFSTSREARTKKGNSFLTRPPITNFEGGIYVGFGDGVV